MNLQNGGPGGGQAGVPTGSAGTGQAGARSGGAGAGVGGVIGGAGTLNGGGTGGPAAGGSSDTTGGSGGGAGTGGSTGGDGGTGGIAKTGGANPGGASGSGGDTGGASSGGGDTGGSSGTGATAGTGGATGGAAGTGGVGGCSREPTDDATCRARGYPPLAYFCPATELWPSTACVNFLPIGSGDGVCCPDEYPTCPDAPPVDGSACSEDMYCSWGSHPEPTCRTSARCASGTWSAFEPPAYCSEPLLPPECPAGPDGLEPMAACSPGGLVCDYDTGDRCTCSDCTVEEPSCGPVGDYTWTCWTPPTGCPTFFPNLGSLCTLPADTECRYTCADTVRCAEGIWVAGIDYCPDCNAPNTLIATPDGARRVAELAPGDLVYSVHRGELAIVPVALVRSKPQRNHHVMRIVLATGTTLEISASHPTADGRVLGDLVGGDELDGVPVVSAQLVPYEYSHTYDILPASDTGAYYAGGVLIGSTLRAPIRVDAPAPMSR